MLIFPLKTLPNNYVLALFHKKTSISELRDTEQNSKTTEQKLLPTTIFSKTAPSELSSRAFSSNTGIPEISTTEQNRKTS